MKSYMIPHVLYKTMKKEVERFEKEVGLLIMDREF